MSERGDELVAVGESNGAPAPSVNRTGNPGEPIC